MVNTYFESETPLPELDIEESASISTHSLIDQPGLTENPDKFGLTLNDPQNIDLIPLLLLCSQTDQAPQIDNPQLNNIKTLEQLLRPGKQHALDEKKKCDIIRILWKTNIIPDLEILDAIIRAPQNPVLKKAVISYFPKVIPSASLVHLITNTEEDIDMRSLALFCAGSRQDVPIWVIDDLIQTPAESLRIRVQALELFCTRVRVPVFQQLLFNPAEKHILRVLAAQKAASRQDIHPDIIMPVLMSPDAGIWIKKRLINAFKDLISETALLDYFNNPEIAIKEKTAILKIFYDRLYQNAPEQFLNMMFKMLQENYSVHREFLIRNPQPLPPELIRRIFLDPCTSEALRDDLIAQLKTRIDSRSFSRFCCDIVSEKNNPLELRLLLVEKEPKAVPFDHVLRLIKNPEELLSMRKALISKRKNSIRFSVNICEMDDILKDRYQNAELKRYIILHFYNYLNSDAIFLFLTQNLQNASFILPIIRQLMRIHYFKRDTTYVRQLLNLSKDAQVTQELITLFAEFMDLKEIHQSLISSGQQKELNRVLESVTDPTRKREVLIKLIDTMTDFSTLDQNIVRQFLNELSGPVTSRLLASVDYPELYKLEIIRHKPRKNDLNETGVLDFIFADKLESLELRAAVFQEYHHLISPGILDRVRRDAKEDSRLLQLLMAY